MGPHGLVASYLHRAPPPNAGQADRRAVRPLDESRGRPAARPPGTRAQAGRRRRPGPRPAVHRVIATLVYLRFQLPHAALAVLYGAGRSTITRAVGEIRPLL